MPRVPAARMAAESDQAQTATLMSRARHKAEMDRLCLRAHTRTSNVCESQTRKSPATAQIAETVSGDDTAVGSKVSLTAALPRCHLGWNVNTNDVWILLIDLETLQNNDTSLTQHLLLVKLVQTQRTDTVYRNAMAKPSAIDGRNHTNKLFFSMKVPSGLHISDTLAVHRNTVEA